MRRPRTLRGTVAVSTVAVFAGLLVGSFLVIERLLSRELHRDLARSVDQQRAFVEAAIEHHSAGGPDALRREILEWADRSQLFVLVGQDGRALVSRPAGARLTAGDAGTADDGRRYRVSRSRAGGYEVAVGLPLAPIDDLRRLLVRVMAVALVAALLAGVLLARGLASRAVAPLLAVSDAADRIDLAGLGARLAFPPEAHAEVHRLSASFNRMLERLEAAVARLQQFTADAAHELRTPLATLKAQSETALAGGGHEPQTVALLRSQLEEVDRLGELVESLLILAQLDGGSRPAGLVDLTDVVLEAVERARPATEARGIALRVAEAEPLRVRGEARHLRRVLDNLLGNAVEYTPAGAITVSLRQVDGRARLEVADTGTGIAPEHVPHVFERFYRADPSRSRETGGAGLGLAIVAGIVKAHEGSVTMESELRRGSRVTVDLPVA